MSCMLLKIQQGSSSLCWAFCFLGTSLRGISRGVSTKPFCFFLHQGQHKGTFLTVPLLPYASTAPTYSPAWLNEEGKSILDLTINQNLRMSPGCHSTLGALNPTPYFFCDRLGPSAFEFSIVCCLYLGLSSFEVTQFKGLGLQKDPLIPCPRTSLI